MKTNRSTTSKPTITRTLPGVAFVTVLLALLLGRLDAFGGDFWVTVWVTVLDSETSQRIGDANVTYHNLNYSKVGYSKTGAGGSNAPCMYDVVDGSVWTFTASADGYYTSSPVVFENPNEATPSWLTISLDPLPPVISSPTTATATVGQPFSSQIVASGNPSSYSATGLPPGLGVDTSSGLISGTPTVSGAFTVTLSAYSSAGYGQANLSLTVYPPVRITTQPASQTVVVGGSAAFAVGASSPAPLSYYWSRNGSPIAGATQSSYTTNNVQLADSGSQFSCLVSNALGTSNSISATLTVLAPPAISRPPSPQTVAAGGSATFSVVATGSAPLSYYWSRNGARIAGATQSSYATNSVQLADSGSQFSCLVSNAVGTASSAAATLTVVAPPVIGTQPSPQAVLVGDSPAFSVAATGSTPLGYYWQRNGSPIPGATQSSYTADNVQLADSGSQFSCLVSNAYGTMLSSNATLTVSPLPLPVFSSQPQSLSASPGASLSFSGTVSGIIPQSYQWFKDGTPISSGTGTGSYSLSLTMSSTSVGNYSLMVSNAGGVATSATAVLGLASEPTVVEGNANLYVGRYRSWQKAHPGDGTGFWPWMTGAGYDGGAIRATWLNDCSGGSYDHYTQSGNNVYVYSTTGTILTVYPLNTGGAFATVVYPGAAPIIVAPAIASQPQNQTILNGGTATLVVAASGTSPLSYQWRKNGSNVPGATYSAFNLFSVQPNDAGTYSVVVTNAAGSATSSGAVLTVLIPQPVCLPVTCQAYSGGRFQLSVGSGSSYEIQASSNLVAWEVLGNLQMTNCTSVFVDTNASPARRFYRARLLQ
jgi:Putative Ig domain/Immunoglobulin domain/Immunoglobulin I-set domain